MPYLSADERGSIISQTDGSGAVVHHYSYDEYGRPGETYPDRYRYTGQKWIAEIGGYDYEARDYLPHLGIFGQPDPIGYDAGANLYAYVLGDPVNLVDPSGMGTCPPAPPGIVQICGERPCPGGTITIYGGGGNVCLPKPSDPSTSLPPSSPGGGPEIVITARKRIKSPCERALGQSGRIEYGGNTVSLILLGGLQVSWGTWRNLRTGSWGNFRTVGGGLGLGIGGTRDYGHASSLANFVGYGETVTAGLSYRGLGGSYSATQDAFGDWVAHGGSFGYSKDLPGLDFRGIGGALTGTAGETTISQCHVLGS